MLFGNRFSRHAPYSTPFIPEDEDVGGGMMQPKPKVGIFAKGGIGRGIVGSIGDALMAQAGMQPLYAQAMEYQRDEAKRLAEAERQAANDDIRRRYMEAQIENMTTPSAPDLPAIVDEWNYRNSLPDAQRADFDKFRRPVPFQYTDEGITAAGKRQEATSAAAAKYRAPAKGGGAPQYEYKMGPNGKLLRRRIG